MESIVQLRQMMAEHKFSEAQKLIEVQLLANTENRHELLKLYREVIEAQGKKLSLELSIELAEFEAQLNNYDDVLEIVADITSPKYYSIISRYKILAAEEKGKMDQLYSLISEFVLRQFEMQIPFIPSWIMSRIDHYFRSDFQLKVKLMAITLLTHDLQKTEESLKDLIISSVERSSARGLNDKLQALSEIIGPHAKGTTLEIYEKLCVLWVHGVKEKAEYKRLVEMILYFEDFKFQVLVLNLLDRLDLKEEAAEYAQTVRANKKYSFVYFDKFFPQLKSYFFERAKTESVKPESHFETPDLKLSQKYESEAMSSIIETEDSEEESSVMQVLKYQDYGTDQLCDLAVGFLQADMPRAALKASELAQKNSTDDRGYLKGSYLKLHCQLQLQDYRAAVDTALDALTKASTKDDVLSFLYGQAEAYIRLNQKKDAKIILTQILRIDAGYRLAKERLEKL